MDSRGNLSNLTLVNTVCSPSHFRQFQLKHDIKLVKDHHPQLCVYKQASSCGMSFRTPNQKPALAEIIRIAMLLLASHSCAFASPWCGSAALPGTRVVDSHRLGRRHRKRVQRAVLPNARLLECRRRDTKKRKRKHMISISRQGQYMNMRIYMHNVHLPKSREKKGINTKMQNAIQLRYIT